MGLIPCTAWFNLLTPWLEPEAQVESLIPILANLWATPAVVWYDQLLLALNCLRNTDKLIDVLKFSIYSFQSNYYFQIIKWFENHAEENLRENLDVASADAEKMGAAKKSLELNGARLDEEENRKKDAPTV
jgi:hypothetical protein